MEERLQNSMMRIVLTGPESVGKSTIAKQLAEHFGEPLVEEYARDYVEKLNRPYCFDDVVRIGRKQIELEQNAVRKARKLCILDTDLIITKVWFDVVYNKTPNWIEEELSNTKKRFHLLLDTAVPWEADDVRENGGNNREWLFEKYKKELENRRLPYAIITGLGEARLQNAICAVEHFMTRNSYP